ncbi:MAG: ABC transporter permease [Oscillibacter sp.]|nr:ABC transporter permease [Oscillibacter sp.]
MKYAARKILMLLVTMVIVSFLAFLAFSLISGDPATAMLGTEATPEKVAALREELGLNRPLLAQYGTWVLGFFTGNLGTSYSYRMPVSSLIGQKLPLTLALSLLSFLLILVVAVPLGIRSARQSESRLDGVHTALNQLFMALPPFFTGILLTWLFGILLHWFTPGKFPIFSEHPGLFFWNLLFPAIAVAIPRIAMTVRMLRSTILHEMNQDYVRTAISRGNDRVGVLYRHVLKNAMAPVIAFLAQTMAEVIAGSIVVEQVFAVPGLGRLLLASIGNRDWPVVEVIVVILAFWVVLANTIGDLLSQRIDPRLRLGGDAR